MHITELNRPTMAETQSAGLPRPRNGDKRTRLVKAADNLFYEQGIHNTTLANIASLADVPLGNVYYYFKSKEAIVTAVSTYRKQQLNQELAAMAELATSKDRLIALVNKLIGAAERTARFGDALGSLCQDLSKQGGLIATASKSIMQDLINWCAKQFSQNGNRTEAQAQKLANHLIANLQGLSLLTLTLNDPEFIDNQSQLVIDWVENNV